MRDPYAARMPQVLLVEDDARIRSALIRALVERGHAVHAEGTGMAALQVAVDLAPDLVVLDLGLPDVARVAADVPWHQRRSRPGRHGA